MSKQSQTLWQRYKYQLNALLLILPVYFYYRSLSPEFPPMWPAQTVGQFEIAPMPFDLDPAYQHEGQYVKDFLLLFNQGDISQIRQAYLNFGENALPLNELQQGSDGILHGSRHGQHVHAIAKQRFSAQDKMWLTIQNWQGEQFVTSWAVPESLIQ